MTVKKIAVLQAPFGEDMQANIDLVAGMVKEAAAAGADIILPPELFQGPYFCKVEKDEFFASAYPWQDHPVVTQLAPLAGELGVALPLSIYEKDGPHYYNSLVMADADGSTPGIYRKSHIPDGPGYEEKFYFRPGNTGFKVWNTRHGRLGVGICWDQWFPETARAMMLMGAQVLLYPTAIGTEPEEPDLDTSAPWRRAMIGHAVSNVVPVAAANRVGDEEGQVFYGTSFIANHRGDVMTELNRTETGFTIAEVDFDAIERARAAFGFFRDRRPDLYGVISQI
ncbi:N-carbamoylputrescine amidase [Aquisalinus flavus]|uniref:N-carbamoylputrescine amidase n=1 Tax=Aquisalinus flavus TaxID=1526572 RepID=A0A8J2V553_9PROT|nr:N-carbamoylputrescine amidase [Aquisalinus flavus]MBD0427848.1 N-carbamoylputrescine amidase [Aquisalinus flavus]UNE47614.1 N-carbamoylputrescine amidase [Aquisalinus flavus]GGD04326.1 N-carbamoylputrescine amidase [Aquisalinus flavus]